MAGILAYFGNHILTRGIIFIDIAVAQIAALGTMIGLLLGLAEESSGVQLISYAFTIVVIALFALTKFRDQVIPQEAIIGIIYCIGLGLAMLLAERIPGGANFISKPLPATCCGSPGVRFSTVFFCFWQLPLCIFFPEAFYSYFRYKERIALQPVENQVI